jgi:hypothetical protein
MDGKPEERMERMDRMERMPAGAAAPAKAGAGADEWDF